MTVSIDLKHGISIPAPLVDINLILYRKRALSDEGTRLSCTGPIINTKPLWMGLAPDEVKDITEKYNACCFYWQDKELDWVHSIYFSEKTYSEYTKIIGALDEDRQNAYNAVLEGLRKYCIYSCLPFFNKDTRYSEDEKTQRAHIELERKVNLKHYPYHMDDMFINTWVSYGHSYPSIFCAPVTGELIASGALNISIEVWDSYDEYVNGNSRF